MSSFSPPTVNICRPYLDRKPRQPLHPFLHLRMYSALAQSQRQTFSCDFLRNVARNCYVSIPLCEHFSEICLRNNEEVFPRKKTQSRSANALTLEASCTSSTRESFLSGAAALASDGQTENEINRPNSKYFNFGCIRSGPHENSVCHAIKSLKDDEKESFDATQQSL